MLLQHAERSANFKAFRTEQAVAFKRHLAEQSNVRTGARLSKSTLYSTLAALKAFFLWLAGQPGYRRLAYSDADRVSQSVGFYYMANACGRLLGTLLSGVLYQQAGVAASLWGAVVLAGAAGIGAMFLPPVSTAAASWAGVKGDD